MYQPPAPPIPPDAPAAIPPPEPVPRKPLSERRLATVLAGLSMLGPFCIDAYLPAFPNIQSTLHASPLEVQQTLTVYLLSFAFMVLWHGALSDTFGRRNVVLVALGVFAVGTFGCAASHSVHYLWVFRMLQGVSAGAGMVVGRAIIRDLYEGHQAARLLSMVTMIFSIAPAIAPVLGGWIVESSDWRTIFLALFGYTGLLGFTIWRRLPETLPPERRQPFNPRFIARSYGQILRSPLFHMKVGVISLNFAGLFLFITAAPAMLPQQLHLAPDEFGWLFIPCVGGIFFGALCANRLAGRTSYAHLIRVGFWLLIGAAVVNVAYHLFLPPALPWTVAPLFFYTFGMSLVAPQATLLALDLFPHIRGTVASCQSFAVTVLAAFVAGVLAPALSGNVLWLALGQLVMTLAALGLWLASRMYRRVKGDSAR